MQVSGTRAEFLKTVNTKSDPLGLFLGREAKLSTPADKSGPRIGML